MSRFKLVLMGSYLLASLLTFGLAGAVSAQTVGVANPAQPAPPSALQAPEQRVALVIGNSKYQNAPQLPNPANDAQSMAQFLNSAGFEVIAATDLTQNDMIKVVQDFSAKIAARGSNTVAMIYYAGHGVQLAGENYLVPVDAKVSTETDLVNNSLRLVDVMATLETIPSRMRIVVLDACRNNPFPTINDAGRGLAIVDAPNGSIVGYSTAPGTEALDGDGNHSPYTSAFLHLARQPNVPIEQLFKRVRLEVNDSTDGRQIPWESSSLTSDFYFFGDTAVAATRTPAQSRMMQTASNLPSRSVRQAYDYVLSEGSPEYYEEFIELYPHDPLSDRIRWLLGNLLQAAAWHNAVLANSPLAYKAFYEKFGNSPYAQTALKLQLQPKMVPLSQPTHYIVPPQLAPTLKLTNIGPFPANNPGGKNVIGGQIVNLPPGVMPKSPAETPDLKKIVTLPAPGTNAASSPNGNGVSKIVSLPGVKPGTNPLPPAGNKGVSKIVTLPAGKLGKIESNKDSRTDKDLRANGVSNRIVDLSAKPGPKFQTDKRDEGVLKLNANPPQGIRPQSGFQMGRTGAITNTNPNASYASMAQVRRPVLQPVGQGQGQAKSMHW